MTLSLFALFIFVVAVFIAVVCLFHRISFLKDANLRMSITIDSLNRKILVDSSTITSLKKELAEYQKQNQSLSDKLKNATEPQTQTKSATLDQKRPPLPKKATLAPSVRRTTVDRSYEPAYFTRDISPPVSTSPIPVSQESFSRQIDTATDLSLLYVAANLATTSIQDTPSPGQVSTISIPTVDLSPCPVTTPTHHFDSSPVCDTSSFSSPSVFDSSPSFDSGSSFGGCDW